MTSLLLRTMPLGKGKFMRIGLVLWFLFCVGTLLTPLQADARCEPGLVRYFQRNQIGPVRVAYAQNTAGPVRIQWFGHAFFRLISPGGTRIVTDPFSTFRGLPIPRTAPHVVTVSEESPNHSSVESVGGNPLILRGVVEFGAEWARIDQRVRDVRILSVPIVQGGGDSDFGGGKAASFLFEMGGLCVAHLGDLGAPMNPEQLRRLGKVHVALVIISDPGAMGPQILSEFIQRLSPNVAIPMDIRSEEGLAVFLRPFQRVKRLKSDTVSITRRNLPPPTEIIVLKQPQEIRQ